MDLNHLEYVCTIAEERSLAKASERLYVSPSALSQHLSKVEGELGTPIFIRSKGIWSLTPAGEAYVAAAKQILLTKRQAYAEIRDIIDGKKGTIRIGFPPGRNTNMFTHIYPTFKRTYPDVRIILCENYVKDLENMLLNGDLDLVVGTSGMDNPNFIRRTLVHERFVLTVPHSHRLAHLASVSEEGDLCNIDLRLFRNDEFIMVHPQTTLRTAVDRLFAAAGFEPNVLFVSNTSQNAHMLAETGYGITIIPEYYVNTRGKAVYFLTAPLGEWELTVTYLTKSYLSVAEEYLISLVEEYYRHGRDSDCS